MDQNLKISLAAARVNAKMTQEDVAKAAKVSKSTVNAWENGKNTPSAATVHFLSEIYNIPVNNIFLPEQST